MPFPAHPLDLFIAFTFVSFAFIGLGLVMATMADNVPAVQALGQCIFLPMLIIGGIAVPLASLPDWAQHVSAFFPGRYAVAGVAGVRERGRAWRRSSFDLLALTIIGAAGCIAGAKMFRWDAQQRFAVRGRSGWLLVPLAAWAAVGVMSEMSNRVTTTSRTTTTFARGTRADTRSQRRRRHPRLLPPSHLRGQSRQSPASNCLNRQRQMQERRQRQHGEAPAALNRRSLLRQPTRGPGQRRKIRADGETRTGSDITGCHQKEPSRRNDRGAPAPLRKQSPARLRLRRHRPSSSLHQRGRQSLARMSIATWCSSAAIGQWHRGPDRASSTKIPRQKCSSSSMRSSQRCRPGPGQSRRIPCSVPATSSTSPECRTCSRRS